MSRGIKVKVDELISKYEGSISDSYLNVAHILKGDKVEGTSYHSWEKRIPKMIEGFDALKSTTPSEQHKEFTLSLYSIFTDYSQKGYLARKIKSSDGEKKQTLEESVKSVCSKALGYLTLTYGGADTDLSYSSFARPSINSSPDSREQVCSALSPAELSAVKQVSDAQKSNDHGSGAYHGRRKVTSVRNSGSVLEVRSQEATADDSQEPALVQASVRKEESFPAPNGEIPDEHRLDESLEDAGYKPSGSSEEAKVNESQEPKTEVDLRLEEILQEAEENPSRPDLPYEKPLGSKDPANNAPKCDAQKTVEPESSSPDYHEPKPTADTYDDLNPKPKKQEVDNDPSKTRENEKIVASIFGRPSDDDWPTPAWYSGLVSRIKGYASRFSSRVKGRYSRPDQEGMDPASIDTKADAYAKTGSLEAKTEDCTHSNSANNSEDAPVCESSPVSAAPAYPAAERTQESFFSRAAKKVAAKIRNDPENVEDKQVSYLRDRESIGSRYGIDKQAFHALFNIFWAYNINPYSIQTKSDGEGKDFTSLTSLLSYRAESEMYSSLSPSEGSEPGPDKIIRNFLNGRLQAQKQSAKESGFAGLSRYKGFLLTSAVVGLVLSAAVGTYTLRGKHDPIIQYTSQAAASSVSQSSAKSDIGSQKKGSVAVPQYLSGAAPTAPPAWTAPEEMDGPIAPTPVPLSAMLSGMTQVPTQPPTQLPTATPYVTRTAIPTITPSPTVSSGSDKYNSVDCAFDNRDEHTVAVQKMGLEDHFYKGCKPMLEHGKDPSLFAPVLPSDSVLLPDEIDAVKNKAIQSVKKDVFPVQEHSVAEAYCSKARSMIREGISLDEVAKLTLTPDQIFPDGTLLPDNRFESGKKQGMYDAIITEKEYESKRIFDAYQKAANDAVSQGKGLPYIKNMALNLSDIIPNGKTCLDDKEFGIVRSQAIESSVMFEIERQSILIYNAYSKEAASQLFNNQDAANIQIPVEGIIGGPSILSDVKVDEISQDAVTNAITAYRQNYGTLDRFIDGEANAKAEVIRTQEEKKGEVIESFVARESGTLSGSLKNGWLKRSGDELKKQELSVDKKAAPIPEPTHQKPKKSAEDDIVVFESEIPPPSAVLESTVAEESAGSVAPLAAEQAIEDVVVGNAISLADKLNEMHQKGQVKLRFNQTKADDVEMWRGISDVSFSVEEDILKGKVSTHLGRGDMAVRILIDGKRTYVEPNAQFEIPLYGNTKIQYQLGEFKDNTFIVGASGIWSK